MLRALDGVEVTVDGTRGRVYRGLLPLREVGGEMDVAKLPTTKTKVGLVLADVGPGIPDVELAMQAGYSTAPDEIRSLGFGAGMGLPNMKKYSDQMEIDTRLGEGTTITMTVKI